MPFPPTSPVVPLQTLQRYTGTLSDNFTYNYTGNKLNSLSGSISASYTYDDNGNMASDGRKNLQFSYNFINLPSAVNQAGALKASYVYSADGVKREVSDNSSNGYAYLGSLIYSKSGSLYSLESTDFGGGRIIKTSSTTAVPHYYTTDHLGSVRVITNNSGNIVEQNDYYPFGGRHTTGRSYTTLATNKYKFVCLPY